MAFTIPEKCPSNFGNWYISYFAKYREIKTVTAYYHHCFKKSKTIFKKALYFENGLEPEIIGSENQENEIETSERENPKE